MTDIAILGAGMAAIGADHRFRERGFSTTLYDQASEPGGDTTTRVFEGGWSFDEGPHVSAGEDRNQHGRYGLWGYQWTDEAFASGEEPAQRVIDSN